MFGWSAVFQLYASSVVSVNTNSAILFTSLLPFCDWNDDYSTCGLHQKSHVVQAILTSSIFTIFLRVDDSLTARVQGTGLGLTITRQILRDHNGDIHYQKNEPTGSIFVTTLPLHTESANDA